VKEGLRKLITKPLACPSLTIQYNKNNPLIFHTGKPLSVSLHIYKREYERGRGKPKQITSRRYVNKVKEA
jgi:hypothetical protein